MLTFSSSILMIYMFSLMAMAFFTLLERKILGYSQTRKGPNKVTLMGLPQPMADALKLFSKQTLNPMFSNYFFFYLAPMLNLALALLMWTLCPSLYPSKFFLYSTLIFLCISSISVYTTLAAGWTSNSKYALLGALRSVAQTISYEVSMALIFINLLLFLLTLSFQSMLSSNHCNLMLIAPVLTLIWFTTMLAETNRAPFDFAEGESELVSGFNTEYASGLFALIFMSEYLNIMFMSLITALIITQSMHWAPMSFILLFLKTSTFSSLFVFTRSTYPRLRYDRLMNLTWMTFLPLSLTFLLLFLAMT